MDENSPCKVEIFLPYINFISTYPESLRSRDLRLAPVSIVFPPYFHFISTIFLQYFNQLNLNKLQ